MLTPTDIADCGERHVENWLTEKGYRCYRHKQRHGTKDLEARSEDSNMLVHINATLEPKAVPVLTQAEHDSICSRAMMLGFDPWLAQLQVDRHGDLYGDIAWTPLK
ncbi:hypothetical protein WJU23_04205 [Prosthecobacter sp. SYSU 5D2]|uniref:hypothetical protein n=1 Tax=Prosthecobacter sp. SYSU 5D2 TaxID=3134134 RepID=UPI0031FF247E